MNITKDYNRLIRNLKRAERRTKKATRYLDEHDECQDDWERSLKELGGFLDDLDKLLKD